MKLDALEHPKTFDLAARLNVTRPTVIGHLELLWVFTAKHAPQGDIGKWPDGAIARACDWMGNPAEFIHALVDARFVDTDEALRLTIHDWRDHAPRWVKSKLAQAGLSMLGATSRDTSRDDDEDNDADDDEDNGGDASPDSKVRKGKVRKGKEREGKSAAREPSKPNSIELTERDHHERFVQIQSAYPKRAGRTDWITAEHHYRQRLADNDATHEQLLDAVTRFAAYIDAVGDTGQKWVLSPVNFFSAVDRPWLQPWDIPEQPRKNGNGTHTPSTLTTMTTEEREMQHLERYIREGLTDEEIAKQLEFMPRETISAKRQEIEHAQQH